MPQYYEVELAVRFLDDEGEPYANCKEERYVIVSDTPDELEALVTELNQRSNEEWRIAWDMRGNPDYETDADGIFIHQGHKARA